MILVDRLGHEKVSTTHNTYLHLFPHKQTQLVSSLEELGAGPNPDTTQTPPTDTIGNHVANEDKFSNDNNQTDSEDISSAKVIPMPIRRII